MIKTTINQNSFIEGDLNLVLIKCIKAIANKTIDSKGKASSHGARLGATISM